MGSMLSKMGSKAVEYSFSFQRNIHLYQGIHLAASYGHIRQSLCVLCSSIYLGMKTNKTKQDALCMHLNVCQTLGKSMGQDRYDHWLFSSLSDDLGHIIQPAQSQNQYCSLGMIQPYLREVQVEKNGLMQLKNFTLY